MAGEVPDISVVIPVYGCEGALEELHRRLTDTLVAAGATYELILVDDRGPDNSWARMVEIADHDPCVGIFRHTRNFGQHAAITAGLARARGRHVVVMDCDLQDPPELIPVLWQRAKEGVDVVFARQDEKVTSPARRILGRIYYRLVGVIAGVTIDARQGTFSLISRRVADAVLGFRDVDRNYVFLLVWLAYPSVVVDFSRDERHSGASAYTLPKLISHALSGLVFQTTKLLRYVVYLGFVFAAMGVLFAAYILTVRLTGSRAPGWSSLAIFTLTIGGFVIMSTGVTGLYIGKMFDQVRERPMSVFEIERPPCGSGAADVHVSSEEESDREARRALGTASGGGSRIA